MAVSSTTITGFDDGLGSATRAGATIATGRTAAGCWSAARSRSRSAAAIQPDAGEAAQSRGAFSGFLTAPPP